MKQEQDPPLVSGGWPVTQWGRGPGAARVQTFRLCTAEELLAKEECTVRSHRPERLCPPEEGAFSKFTRRPCMLTSEGEVPGEVSALHSRGLPLLGFLESPSRTLLVNPGERQLQTLSSVCGSSLGKPSPVDPQRERGHGSETMCMHPHCSSSCSWSGLLSRDPPL